MNWRGNSKLCLDAPAKVNLALRVLGKRPDGYHDLQSLMVPLSVGDVLEIEASETWDAFCDHPDVPVGEGSLIEKAFRLAAEKLGYSGGMRVRLQKKIPMGAGMGGGSSDAASVMRAVERLTGKRLSPETYQEIAFRVGADVPFFLKDGPKWVEGVGQKITGSVKLPKLHILLVNPGLHIATKWVYERLNLRELTGKGSAASLPTAFSSVADLIPQVTNDLESVVLPHYPVVAGVKQRLGALGADAALMSGSGSTVFGLFSDPKKRDEALTEIRREHPDFWVCACDNLSS